MMFLDSKNCGVSKGVNYFESKTSMNNDSVIKEIDIILDSAFFCPLTTSFSQRINMADEISEKFDLDPDLMEEYLKAATALVGLRRKKGTDKKSLKSIKTRMQFLHMLIFKKLAQDHPQEVEEYKKYQALLYSNFPHLDDFVFEPEWVELSHEFCGMRTVLEELERVTREIDKLLPDLSDMEMEQAEELSDEIANNIFQESKSLWKDDTEFREYIKKEVLPYQPKDYQIIIYAALYREFCVLTLETWVTDMPEDDQ